MSPLVAFVLSGASEPITARNWLDRIRQTWPDFGPIDGIAEGEDQFSFDAGETFFALQWIPHAVPVSDVETMLDCSLLWPDARSAFEGHRSHWIVVAGGDEEPLGRAKKLTQVISAALGSAIDGVGVLWGQAGTLIRADVFAEYAKAMLPNGPALHLWVDFRAGQEGSGRASGHTLGLANLGHREIEALNAPRSVGELRELMQNIAAYLLANGPVIMDGHTIGEDEFERISVRMGPSQFTPDGEVMRLEFKTGSAAN